jgi:UDP-galactopyranose mutase
VNRPDARTDVLVVGAGFAGSVVAERVASAGKRVTLVEKHTHIGGHAFDHYDDHGILVHKYGPHIFHTNLQHVFEYLSRFTSWRPYEHRVLASVDGQLLPIPINLDTINRLYGLDLDEKGVRDFFERVREHRDPVLTSEDVVVNAVGGDLYEKFYRNYTRKQWGVDPSELDACVAARISVRTNTDDRYFTDRFQFMPLQGYAKLFERMLDHQNIDVKLGTDYFEVRDRVPARYVVYTGPIDAFFEYRCGRLPYRSLEFEHEHIPGTPRYQPVAVVNFPNDHKFTRITEFKHLTGQEHSGTSIIHEFPRSHGDPYYPVPNLANEELSKRYAELAKQHKDVLFVGRLAQYRYYNMDQVVDAALAASDRLLKGMG